MNMKIAVVQIKPELLKKEYNVSKITHLIKKVNADLIIFPELSFSGYFFNSREEAIEFSDECDSPFIKQFIDLSHQQNKALVLGFAEKTINENFNSSILILPEEKKSFIYRKTHLFYRERFCFNEGNTGFFNVYWESKDINIGMMICYDWRFPESTRTLALKGSDLIVCPSNLVTDVWHISMPSRALENKVYLAVSNRTGTETRGDESLLFKGESGIWNYNGSIISKADKVEEDIIYAEIEPEKTRNKSFNEYNDIFKDRRPELYI
jgi:predicted amidohydrolase